MTAIAYTRISSGKNRGAVVETGKDTFESILAMSGKTGGFI